MQIFVAKYETMDKFTLMQTFVRVAEAGSFTAVAHQMDVPRSMITRQIAGLESQLGVKLMTRSTRSLSLTTAGSAYLEKCRVILNLVDATESSLVHEQSAPRGQIRISLPLSFGLQKLLPILMDFAKQNAEIKLAMDFSDRHSNLIEEGLDMAVRITANLDSTDIVRKLGVCKLITVASPSYLDLHGIPLKPSDLRHHECLDYSLQPSVSSWTYMVGGERSDVSIEGRLVANNGVALAEAAARGFGIARQPDFIVDSFLQDGRLVRVLGDYDAPELGIYAVLPSNRYIPHRISVLMEFISSEL